MSKLKSLHVDFITIFFFFFQVGCQSCGAVRWSDVVAAARSKERSKRLLLLTGTTCITFLLNGSNVCAREVMFVIYDKETVSCTCLYFSSSRVLFTLKEVSSVVV